MPLRLGVRLESLGLPLRRALMEAGKLGVVGIQVDAAGDLSPNNLSQTGRREFRHLLRAHNLELTAVGCPLRRGLDVAEDQQPRVEFVQKVMSLSFDLGPRIAIVEAGQIPEDAASPRGLLLKESLDALGRHGDRTGTTLALETGHESGAALRDFLARFDTGGLGVNFDPANLLQHGLDVYQSLRDLTGKVIHAHARDARSARANRAAAEVPLGHGDIDWMTLLGIFTEIEYRGWLVVERQDGDDRVGDLKAGITFLRRFVDG